MEGVYRNWSWRWGWWVDEELFAAAYTVVVEGFGHVNVDDVDTGGLGIGDSLIDGAIQAGCGVVDLGLEEVRQNVNSFATPVPAQLRSGLCDEGLLDERVPIPS